MMENKYECVGCKILACVYNKTESLQKAEDVKNRMSCAKKKTVLALICDRYGR